MKLCVVSVIALVGLLYFPQLAGAQSSVALDPPRADVSVGIANQHELGESLSGFYVSGSWRPWRYVGFAGDLSNYRHLSHSHGNLVVGVRVQATGRIAPFVQLLTTPDLSLQAGAGVDIRLSRRLAVRVAGDLLQGGDDGFYYVSRRLSAGAVVRFGQR